MMINWITSSLWVFFMLIGVTFIRHNNMKENFKEIFQEDAKKIDNVILFDSLGTLIIISFFPIFNILYLIMYLILGFCDKDNRYIQEFKRVHEESRENKGGDYL